MVIKITFELLYYKLKKYYYENYIIKIATHSICNCNDFIL